MTTSNEAIAAAREVCTLFSQTADCIDIPNDFPSDHAVASIIQKHYAAKDAEIDQIKIDIAEIRRQHQQEANEWKTDEELTQERDQLKARVAELEKALKAIVDEAWGISQKALAATNPKALTRLQELERKAKALDWLEIKDKETNLGCLYSGCRPPVKGGGSEGKALLLSVIESAVEKQK